MKCTPIVCILLLVMFFSLFFQQIVISVFCVSFQSLSRLYLEDNRRATLQAGFSVASDHRTSLVTWTQAKSPSQLPSEACPPPTGRVFAGGVVVEQGRKVSAGGTGKANRGARGQDLGVTCLGDVWPGGPHYLPTRHTRDWASCSVANNTCGTDISILLWITNLTKLGMFLELEFIQAHKKTK